MNFSLKVIVSLAVLTALIIGLSIYSQATLRKNSSELEQTIAKVENNAASNNWKAAEQDISNIKSKWSGVKGTWAILIDHQEIDNIEESLSRVEKFIQAKETASAMAEASVLRSFVNHIPIREKLSIENVF